MTTSVGCFEPEDYSKEPLSYLNKKMEYLRKDILNTEDRLDRLQREHEELKNRCNFEVDSYNYMTRSGEFMTSPHMLRITLPSVSGAPKAPRPEPVRVTDPEDPTFSAMVVGEYKSVEDVKRLVTLKGSLNHNNALLNRYNGELKKVEVALINYGS